MDVRIKYLTPHEKYAVSCALKKKANIPSLNNRDISAEESKVIWFVSEIVSAANTREELYVVVPPELHSAISEYIEVCYDPPPGLVVKVEFLHKKHNEALQYLREKLVEELIKENGCTTSLGEQLNMR